MVLFEKENFKHKELAASIISKIYYNLQDYDKALDYALTNKGFISG
jgi:26S proteasome regulatory subunit N2